MSVVVAFLGLRGTIVAGILTALLLAASGIAGWQYVRAERAVLAEGRAENAQAAAEAGLRTCEQANASAVAAENARRSVAAENAKALAAALDRARDAVAAAAAGRQRAEADLREWRRIFGSRGPGCTAALNALDTACPEVESY